MSKNNIENILKPDERIKLEERLRRLEIEYEYIQNKLPEDVSIIEIQRNLKFNFKEMNIQRDVNDISLVKVRDAEREYYKVLSYSETAIEQSEISRVANMLKMSEQDIGDILKSGLTLKEIEENGIKLIKDATRKNKAISPNDLKELLLEEYSDDKVNQVVDVASSNGKIIIVKLDEIGEVNERGELQLSDDLREQLKPFEMIGSVNLDERLYLVKEKEDTVDNELGKDIYKAVPEDKVEEKVEKQEEEKEEISKALDENSEDIIGIIRVTDTETCSQLLNDDSIKTTGDKVLIVRFKNNRFKAMKEDASGNKSELVDFRATPVFKNVASSIENKVGNLYSNFEVGDITAGKRIDGQKYDIFYVDTGTRGNGIGNLVVVNSDGENHMDMVKPTECGGYEIEFADNENVYPKTVVMDSKDGNRSKHIHKENNEIEKVEDEKDEVAYEVADNYSGSIEEEKRLLEELLKVEDEIFELKNSPKIELGTTLKNIAKDSAIGYAMGKEAGAAIGSAEGLKEGMDESKENIDEKIKSLEERRDDILSRLGYSKKDLIQAKEEAEMLHTHRRH